MTLRLVIFDLDGTLLRAQLDFDAMRREIGLPPGITILEGMEELDDAGRERAARIVARHEARAAEASRLMPGAEALLARLRREGVKLAVLTRNSRASLGRACRRHGLAFDAAVTREDMTPKPSPDGVHHLMEACGADPEETVVVGDYRYDIEAGAAAGCRTVALAPEPPPPWAAEATWQAADLEAVGRILDGA